MKEEKKKVHRWFVAGGQCFTGSCCFPLRRCCLSWSSSLVLDGKREIVGSFVTIIAWSLLAAPSCSFRAVKQAWLVYCACAHVVAQDRFSDAAISRVVHNHRVQLIG